MTDIPAGPDRDIPDGAARMLAATNIGFTYLTDDTTPYADDAVAVVVGVMPETPDRCVALNWVTLTDEVEIPTATGMLQAAVRGRPNDAFDVLDLSAAMKQIFHGATALQWGSVTVVQMNRRNSVPMGQDQNERLERADHYDLDIEYPPTANVPTFRVAPQSSA